MPLRYDFDMFSAIDESIIDDPKYKDLFASAGIRSDMAANKVALFRDQKTVDALRAAPEPLRRYLLDCGFGLNRFDSGAPDGYYPAKDEAARLRVLDALENPPAPNARLLAVARRMPPRA